MQPVRAVLFDLGGVVIDSPLHAIHRYERLEQRAFEYAFLLSELGIRP